MMITTHHPLVAEYLQRLRAAIADLPPEERDELASTITEHIITSLAEIPEPTDADVQAVLQRLGPPAAIAAEARRQSSGRPFAITPSGAPAPRAKPGALEWGGIAMLGVGSYLLPILGTATGLVMVAISPWWTTRQKVAAFAISLSAFILLPVLGLGLFLATSSGTSKPPAPMMSVVPTPSRAPSAS